MTDFSAITEWIRPFERVMVAFSGGTDSSTLAVAVYQTLGAERCAAVMLTTPMAAAGEVESARNVATAIGIPFETICLDPLSEPLFRRNAPDRCYHCKKMLFTAMLAEMRRREMRVVVSGDHRDDLSAYRPGRRALDELGVRRPFVEIGWTKSDIRALARHCGLVNAERPATPCLATRVAYGVEITANRLRNIDQAEAALRTLGLENFRVRLHSAGIAYQQQSDGSFLPQNSSLPQTLSPQSGKTNLPYELHLPTKSCGETFELLARLELPDDCFAKLGDVAWRTAVLDAVYAAGFQKVTLDLAEFRSGSSDQAWK